MWPGPRPTCTASGIVIHPTVWPQYTNVQADSLRQTDNDTIALGNRFTNGRPKSSPVAEKSRDVADYLEMTLRINRHQKLPSCNVTNSTFLHASCLDLERSSALLTRHSRSNLRLCIRNVWQIDAIYFLAYALRKDNPLKHKILDNIAEELTILCVRK